ncbi:MAG: subtype B tannase [bacterium]|nr:subtype B tannase [bacterium]
MRNKKMVTLLFTGMMMAMAITSCATTSNTDNANSTVNQETQTQVSLNLSEYASKWIYNETYDVYVLENVVYCANPANTELQSMNIYVPAAYMNEDGTIKEEGSITNSNGTTYQATTAPIVYSNGVWGYSEAKPGTIDDTSAEYVQSGMILVCVGSRGKESVNADGSYIGKAPDGLVDLKAGIRFLKSNDSTMAGDSNKIVSVGLSAGGAMSALLGTTGNSSDYTSYLEEIGAVMSATDDIYGTMAYCPITNLENSDMTYEWMFTSDTTYSGSLGVNRKNDSSDSDSNSEMKGGMGGNKGGASGTLTEEEKQNFRQNGGMQGAGSTEETELNKFQLQLSSDLAGMYPTYINSLNLGLTLGEDGRSGTYYEAMMKVIANALNSYLKSNYNTAEEKAEYIATLNAKGQWVSWDASSETADITDLDAFVTNYLGRAKSVLGFDLPDLSAQENKVFGTEDTDLGHYSSSVAELLASNDYSSLEGYDASLMSAYSTVLTDSSLQERVALMNPFNYINTEEESTISPFFRIRVGTQDADSAFATAFNLATALQQAGVDVDYEMLWGQGHRVMEMNGEFVQWIDEICK